MTRSRIMQILLIMGSVLVIIGVNLVGWVTSTRDERNVIDVQLAEGETEYIGLSEGALSKDDAFKNVVAYWDNITNTYKLNEEKFNALTVE